jgi:hypothetical protein
VDVGKEQGAELVTRSRYDDDAGRNSIRVRYSKKENAYKKRLLADYQSAAKPITLPADKKTGLPR